MKKQVGIICLHLLIIVAIFTGAVFALNSWLSSYTHHGESITVPDVVGVNADEALDQLHSLGLEGSIIDTVFSEEVDRGAVVEQLPEKELPVKKGRVVYLTVNSTHKQQKTIPNLLQILNGPLRNAQSVLMQNGFRPDSVEYVAAEFDDEVLMIKTYSGLPVADGESYDIHTRLILVVGTTRLEMEQETDETIDGDWME